MPRSKNTRPRCKRAPAVDFQGLRVSLFQAAGVVRAVRGALNCTVPAGEDQLQDALSLAARTVDDVASQLEGLANA